MTRPRDRVMGKEQDMSMGRTIDATKEEMLEAIQKVLDEAHQRAQTSRLQRDRVRASGYSDGVRHVMHMVRDWNIQPENSQPEPTDELPEVPYQMLDDARTAFHAEKNPRIALVAALTAANLWSLEYFRIASEAFNVSGIGDTSEKALIRALRAVLKEVKEKERV